MGKTDINSNKYDILVFASRDVGSFTIPPFIEHISCYAFAWSLIESITIPQQVKEICDGAFYECKKLHKVEIQNDSMLNSLGKYAFYCSKIESILIPPNIKEIHQGAFSSCKSLKTIIFANNSNLKIIGKYAFLGTDIQNIQIPATVEVIGEGSFEDCKSLIRIEIPVDSELRIIEKFAFRKASIRSITIPQKFTEFKEEWCYETPNLTDIKINENNPHYKLYKNKFIVGKNDPTSDVYDILVFVPRNIKTIIIPSFIKCIASCAFEMSLIQSIFIPTKVSKICKSAFKDCKQLSQVDFANDSELQEIEENAFISTSIKKISIPSNVKKICERGFGYCEQLKKIIVPKNSELREIESDAFIRTPIESFFIPKHLVQLHRHAFSSCENISLVEIDQNTELKTFECTIFQYAKKDTVFKIPSHVTLINYDNFKKIKPVIIKL